MMPPAASLPAPGASGLSLRLPRLSRRALVMAALTVSAHGLLVFAWQHLPRASGLQGKTQSPTLQVSLVPAKSLMTPPSGAADTVADTRAEQAAERARASALASRSNLPLPPATYADATAAPSIPREADALTASLPAAAMAQPVSNPAATPDRASSKSMQHATVAPIPVAPLQRASNEWAYLPAAELDRRPVPEGDITLPFPESENLPRGTRVSAVLVLYVGADGAVDRVEFAQSALPPAFARTATETFARVRMRPGIKDGQPRRAMMKIEVEFEAPAFRRPAMNAANNAANSAANNAAPTVVLESSRSWQDSQ